MPQTALIKALARNLKYRELTDWIGKQVYIRSTLSIEEDIRAELGDTFPVESKLIEREKIFHQRVLSKYGLMDLTFGAPRGLLDRENETGIPLLKKLGFVGNGGVVEVAQELRSDDATCLTELDQELQQGQTVIRLLLEANKIQHSLIGDPPPEYVGMDFIIVDACVTNSGFVWFHKHFYL